MFSMSFGLMSPADEPPPRMGIPSIINRGSLFCPELMDEIARMMIWELELGEPPLPDTCTPAIFPCREFTKFADCPAVTSSAFRLWTAKFSFFFSSRIPIAVTTTSSNCVDDEVKVTLMTDWFPTCTVFGCIPT